jgi:histone H3/H4
MPEYTADQLLGQALVAFGQGTGAVRVHRETITAIRTRYEPLVKKAMEHWKEDAPQALERIRATGRVAALLATQAGRMAITAEDFTQAANKVAEDDIRRLGAPTRICQIAKGPA